MRLDKYLKVSRLIKRRPLAKEVAEKGRISVNGTQAKPGTNVKVGDELHIRLGQRMVTVRVDAIKENARKEEASDMYTILKEERVETEEF